MNPVSRTPEGQNNRCPVCGQQFAIEPSQPTGDATCPFCNSLVWFHEIHSEPLGVRESMVETKRRGRVIVAEIVELTKGDISLSDCCEGFLRRTIEATLAAGGIVWLRSKNGRLEPQTSIQVSARAFDQFLDDSANHLRLLEYVAKSNTSQIVPPSVMANDQSVGGNPSQHRLFFCPLRNGDAIMGVVEIFQRAEMLPATERAHLGFLEQMCGYLSEFLARQ